MGNALYSIRSRCGGTSLDEEHLERYLKGLDIVSADLRDARNRIIRSFGRGSSKEILSAMKDIAEGKNDGDIVIRTADDTTVIRVMD